MAKADVKGGLSDKLLNDGCPSSKVSIFHKLSLREKEKVSL